MPPSAVSPGTRLDGRYRLAEELAPAGPGAPTRTWRAVDELLGRDVQVRTAPVGTAPADAALAVARSAADLPDQRFVRVLDAGEVGGWVYLVSERVEASPLPAVLAAGPLADAEAARIAYEVADALRTAREAGVAHGRLVPEQVLLTVGRWVRLDVTLLVPDDPGADTADAADDAWAAGAVLYAGLTGRWPAPGTVLPAAPHGADGRPCAPRQLRAGIPSALDDVARRALGLRGRRAAEPLRSPADVAAVLAAPAALAPPPADDRPAAATAAGGATTRLAWTAAGTLMVSGLALGAWQLAALVGDATGVPLQPRPVPGVSGTAPPGPSAGPVSGPVEVAAVRDHDPQGNGAENPDLVPLAVDGDPATAWRTVLYYDQLGPQGLKEGVGLLVDLGRRTDVATVTLDLLGRGTDLQLRAGDTLSEDLDGFPVVAARQGVGPTVTLLPDEPLTARYLLVWLTALPPDEGGFRGGVRELVVRG